MLIEKGRKGHLISGDLEVDKEQSFPIVWTRMVVRYGSVVFQVVRILFFQLRFDYCCLEVRGKTPVVNNSLIIWVSDSSTTPIYSHISVVGMESSHMTLQVFSSAGHGQTLEILV